MAKNTVYFIIPLSLVSLTPDRSFLPAIVIASALRLVCGETMLPLESAPCCCLCSCRDCTRLYQAGTCVSGLSGVPGALIISDLEVVYVKCPSLKIESPEQGVIEDDVVQIPYFGRCRDL